MSPSTFTPGDTKVCVVGLGYIGLPTAAVLASRGYSVHGVEVAERVVATINEGRAHIVEPDLDMLVQASVSTGRLRAHLAPAEADVFLLCVPTPANEAHEPVLDYVHESARQIAPFVRAGNLVVLESTSPPGTTEEVARIVREVSGIERIHFVHAPERVLPGKILREVVENDRLIGGIDDASTAAGAAFYRTFVTGPLHLTDARTAETAKLTENAFRDVNIAFANEMSLLAEELDIDVWELIDLANKHPRVNILKPGPGVGGHCIAVDPWFLIWKSPKTSRLLRTAREVNDAKPHWVVERIRERASRLRSAKIALLGLAYKPNVDDLRESPAVDVAKAVLAEGLGEVRVVEPYCESHPDFDLVPVEEAIEDADVIVILVAHDQFRKLPRKLLEERIIIDTCGLLRSLG